MCQTAIMKEQKDILNGMKGYMGIIRTKATYIESRMMNNFMTSHEYTRLMQETVPDHEQILEDTKWYMSLEEEATRKISDQQELACASVMGLIKNLHSHQWNVYKLRGVMNMYIKRNSIIKQRMIACLRSHEGIDEQALKDKMANEKDIQEQSIKIEDAIEVMKKWKDDNIENLSDDLKAKIKKIRQEIKKVYVQISNEAIKKEEAIETEKADEDEVISISAEDAMMEDVDGWVEPMIKKSKH